MLIGPVVAWFVVVLLTTTGAYGHRLWINVSDHYPEHGYANVCFGWGHDYPLSDFLRRERLASFELLMPDGIRKSLTPNEGGYLATKIDFKNMPNPGHYVVAASLRPGYYTMYIENGEVHHKVGPKSGVSGRIILSTLSQQNAKVLVTLGSPQWDPQRLVVGHKNVELIPLDDPAKLNLRDILRIKVLRDGNPVSNTEVRGTYLGFDSLDEPACLVTTNDKGIASIRVLAETVWTFATTIKEPAPKQLAEKCNELWFTGTLTLHIR